MSKVLVIQGAGMNMRGKVQVEVFGPSTLEQINEQVRGYAEALGIDVEIMHSNVEGEVVNALYDAHDRDIDAALINPAGYTTGSGPLKAAIAQVRFPVIEVHASNPTSRGTVSNIQPVSKGSVYGFGVYSYYLALEGVKHLVNEGESTRSAGSAPR
ncbi:MAG TPA: type II 3-dehydroquinate dehydratase [Dehalococcoidia bacterium]|nr:type II 3-dehydroquinate dehydratase [Dehalococcoidia bacterium]